MDDVAAKVGLSASRLDRIGRHFRRYVDDGRLAGLSTLVSRRGEVAHRFTYGWRDLEARAPMTEDTIVRIYSMTKPVTTVGLLTLYEEGRFSLGDPVSAFLPALGGLRVFDGGDAAAYRTRPPEREVTVVDLLTHTAGLTYWFQEQSPVDDLYRRAGVDRDSCPDLATMVARLGELPLVFSPGTRWNYSVATDVVGRLIEVIAGQPLDRFLAERVIEPLGMVDTGFSVPADRVDRLAANYRRGPEGTLERVDGTTTSSFARPPTFLSGGGGLVSTAEDYHRFCLMILNGGCLEGERILGRKTVEYLGRNHLPGGRDLAGMGRSRFSETSFEGIGFGLGFSVVLDPARAQVLGSPGELAWGGAASTMFWIDPTEELIGILLTQLVPSATYPLRREMRVLTNQALVD